MEMCKEVNAGVPVLRLVDGEENSRCCCLLLDGSHECELMLVPEQLQYFFCGLGGNLNASLCICKQNTDKT